MNESTSVLADEASLAAMPRAGDVVGGKYRLIRLLGEGGMGVVFEAAHVRLRRSVAIKFLRPDAMRSPDAVERFEREARASGRMRGPHVVHVIDVDTQQRGRPYMVMDLLRGRDLEAELRAKGSLPIAEAIDWVLQACAAVAEAHAAGIVHRDLKPSNLFLSDEAGARVVKVLDFGVSKSAFGAERAVTSAAVTVGTPLYMSPEQVRSSKDVDQRTDVWSLGVILYELIAGTPPFFGNTTAAIAAIVADATPSLRAVRAEVPEALDRAIMTALAKAPENRFPSTEALGAALMPFASAEAMVGPFSLRPSRRAFEIAAATMALAPSGPRASDALDLLNLPTARTTAGARRDRSRWEWLRTVAGSAAIGVGLAIAATVAIGSPPRRAARTARASATQRVPERSMGPHVAVGSRPRPPCSANVASSAQPDCLNPSGSSGGGGRSIRRSPDP
ncbi:MAG TPA: serine/threonine-protein kinase [Polyangiaceae bacterium]|nr:serine/threonine-protein kinase [Polyangiaceae bacterium]